MLISLGHHRDGLLVALGLLYALGYLSWSFMATAEGVGPLPVIDIQYFFAGVPPMLILITVGILIRKGSRAFDAWGKWFYSQRSVLRWSVGCALGLTAGAAVAVVFDSDRVAGLIKAGRTPHSFLMRFYGAPYSALLLFAAIIFILLFCVAFMKLLDMGFRYRHRPELWLPKVYRIATVIAVGLVIWVIVLREYYPRMPEALGGLRWRVAILDVAPDGISAPVLSWLNPDDPGGTEPVVVSRPLEVLYAGSDYLIVRARARRDRFRWRWLDFAHAGRAIATERDTVTQLLRPSVKALRWIGPPDAR